MQEESKEDGVRPAAREVQVIYFCTNDVTPTPSSQTNEKAFNGWRHNDKYVFISTGVLSYSIHIQWFSQN